MKQLATLIRLQQRSLDELRQQLAKLEGKRDHYVEQIEKLADELQEELQKAEAMPELRGFFGDFSGSIKQRQHVIAAHLLQTETQIQKMMVDVQEQFSELKKFEIAKEQFDAREAKAARAKEQAEMDEIGIRNAIYMET